MSKCFKNVQLFTEQYETIPLIYFRQIQLSDRQLVDKEIKISYYFPKKFRLKQFHYKGCEGIWLDDFETFSIYFYQSKTVKRKVTFFPPSNTSS